MTMDALFMCAHSSPSLAQRRHAAYLMRRPRSEGLWPTLMASRLADAVLEREMEALEEYKREIAQKGQREAEGASDLPLDEAQTQQEAKKPDGDTGDYYEEDSPHGLHRIRTIAVKLENGRRARLTLQTWGESVKGLPGRESILTW